MHQAEPSLNPFAMMLDPERILRAVEASERLNHLASRICRPLDRIANVPAEGDAEADTDADLQVDALQADLAA